MTILQKNTGDLTDRETRTRGFLIHLIHGSFSAATYLESIAFLKDFAETDQEQQTDSHEDIDKDEKPPEINFEESQHESADTDAADTVSQTEQMYDSAPSGTENTADESNLNRDSVEQIETVSLRSEPAILSSQEQKKMLVENCFYDRYRNPHSRGFANHFKTSKAGPVISDRASELMWQQSGSEKSMAHEQAQAYIDQLNLENFAGFHDWRLPTLAEAMSLMDHKQQQSGLYIDTAFDNRQTGIWTADMDKASRVWVAYYSNGNCGHYQFGNQNFVRAVRSLSAEK
jgi:hypothetical protein